MKYFLISFYSKYQFGFIFLNWNILFWFGFSLKKKKHYWGVIKRPLFLYVEKAHGVEINIFPQCLGNSEFKYDIVCLYFVKKELHKFQLP